MTLLSLAASALWPKFTTSIWVVFSWQCIIFFLPTVAYSIVLLLKFPRSFNKCTLSYIFLLAVYPGLEPGTTCLTDKSSTC